MWTSIRLNERIGVCGGRRRPGSTDNGAKYAQDLQHGSATCAAGFTVVGIDRCRCGGPTFRKPTGDGALGVPALEDKIVQGAAAEVLSAIYEADFLDCSFRV